MNRLTFLLVLMLLAALPTHADDESRLSLAELRARGAVLLTKDDLQVLLPGTRLTHRNDAGYTRRWDNNADGVFVATSEGMGIITTARFTYVPGHGKWHIADNGTYCVSIEWRQATEQWCRFVFKAGDRYYGIVSLDNPDAKAAEFSLAK